MNNNNMSSSLQLSKQYFDTMLSLKKPIMLKCTFFLYLMQCINKLYYDLELSCYFLCNNTIKNQ